MNRKVALGVLISLTIGFGLLLKFSALKPLTPSSVTETPQVEPLALKSVTDPQRRITPQAESPAKSSVFVGKVLYEGDEVGPAFNGQVVVANAGTTSVRASSGHEVAQFDEFVMIPGFRILYPTAFDGDVYEVRDGIWTMPVPDCDQVVARVLSDSSPLMALSGRRILAGRSTTTVRVKEWPRVPIVAKDAVSGEPVSDLTIKSQTRSPRGRPIKFVFPKDSVADRSVSDTNQAKNAPAPPDFAEALGEHLSSNASIAPLEFEHTIWVGSSGYQWERISVGPETIQISTELRPTRKLTIIAETEGWKPRNLAIRVRRGSELQAIWKDIQPASVYSIHDLGIGTYAVSLTCDNRVFSSTLVESVVEVPIDHDVEIVLQPKGTYSARTGKLKLNFFGLEEPVAEVNAIKLLTIRIAPITHDSVFGVYDSRPMSASDLTDVARGGKSIEYAELPHGEYFVSIDPFGIRKIVNVIAGEPTEESFDLSNLGLLKIWPDLSGLPAELHNEARTLELYWDHLSNNHAFNFTPVQDRTLSDLTPEGCWEIRSPAGKVRVHLLGRDKRIWHSQVFEVSQGVSEVAASLDGEKMSFAQIDVSGLSEGTLGALLNGLQVRMIGSSDTAALPTAYDWIRDKDRGLVGKLFYSIPEHWLKADLKVTLPMSDLQLRRTSSSHENGGKSLHLSFVLDE